MGAGIPQRNQVSAAPLEPGDGTTVAAFDWQGALTSVMLGGAAMLARLLTMKRASWGFIIRSVVSAGVAAYFVGEATQDHFGESQQGLWMASIGLAGYASPELLTYLLRVVKAKGEGMARKEEAKLKPNGKTKRKRRG